VPIVVVHLEEAQETKTEEDKCIKAMALPMLK